MFCVVETIENGTKFLTAVPRSWVVGSILLWPTTRKDTILGRKNCTQPMPDWLKIQCEIIFDKIVFEEKVSVGEKEEFVNHQNSWEIAVKMEKEIGFVSDESPPKDLNLTQSEVSTRTLSEMNSKLNDMIKTNKELENAIKDQRSVLAQYMVKTEGSIKMLNKFFESRM